MWPDWKGALAALGAASGILGVWAFVRDRPRVRVTFVPREDCAPTPTGTSGCYRVISVVNRGRRRVTIEDLGLEYLGGQRHRAVIYWPAGGMPRALDESGVVKGFIPCDAVNLKDVSRAFAQVSDGRLYRSRKYKHAKTSSTRNRRH